MFVAGTKYHGVAGVCVCDLVILQNGVLGIPILGGGYMWLLGDLLVGSWERPIMG